MFTHCLQGGYANLSKQSIDIVTGMARCECFCASCLPAVNMKTYEEYLNKHRQEVKNLEPKIPTIANSFERKTIFYPHRLPAAKKGKVLPSLMI